LRRLGEIRNRGRILGRRMCRRCGLLATGVRRGVSLGRYRTTAVIADDDAGAEGETAIPNKPGS